MSRTPEDILVEQRLKNGFNPKIVSDNTEVRLHNDEVIFEIEKQIKSGVDVPYWRAYNMLNLESMTPPQYKQLGLAYSTSVTDIKKSLKNVERNEQLVSKLGGTPKNEYEFVNFQLAKWNTNMSFAEWFKIETNYVFGDNEINNEQFNQLDYETRVQIELSDPKRITLVGIRAKLIKQNSLMDLGYNDNQIDHALNDWVVTEKNKIIGALTKEILYNPRQKEDADIMWNIFIESITGTNIDETKLVMKHFIWQIKRKMFNKSVDYHMMPVMKGEQGIGKSSIIRSLLSPIKEFVADTNFNAITEDKNHNLWKNFVLVFDEMGRSTNNNIEEIKRRITAEQFTSRIMKTNTDTIVENKATFIGSTNRDISSMIIDNTGMRRFFQIECLSSFDWMVTNSIDFLMLWRSIDENAKTPLLQDGDLFNKIGAIQEEKRFITIVEEFLKERKYCASVEKIKALTFFQEFQQYEKDHTAMNKYTSAKFGKDVMEVFHRIDGLNLWKGKSNGGIYYGLKYENWNKKEIDE